MDSDTAIRRNSIWQGIVRKFERLLTAVGLSCHLQPAVLVQETTATTPSRSSASCSAGDMGSSNLRARFKLPPLTPKDDTVYAHVVVIGFDKYVIQWTDATARQAIDRSMEWAAEPDLNYKWSDAIRFSELVLQTKMKNLGNLGS